MIRILLAAVLACLCARPQPAAAWQCKRPGDAFVASLNAKLARYVRPSGACGGSPEGLATYYDRGRRTANGERFDPHGLTLAHCTLPFGTWLTLRNPNNGRWVRARVNDRGPATIADVDVAAGVARRLGMTTSMYLCVD